MRLSTFCLLALLPSYPCLFTLIWVNKTLDLDSSPSVVYNNYSKSEINLFFDSGEKETLEPEPEIEESAAPIKVDKTSALYKKFVSFIKEKEGFRAKRYVCCGGVTTVGFGLTASGVFDAKRYGFLPKNYTLPQSLTKAEAEKLLATVMIPTYLAMVKSKLKVNVTEGQRLALASFAFNLGQTPLNRVLYDVNNGIDPLPRMQKYIYAKGKVREGLVKRRAGEKEFWNSGEKLLTLK